MYIININVSSKLSDDTASPLNNNSIKLEIITINYKEHYSSASKYT